MAYANKVAETKPKEDLKNPPDATPDDWRNPWKGAAIGGTLGGLVTTALGYLYGHRGRWLAYDAIAGGGTGAAIGYGVDAHNNAKAVESEKPENKVHPNSLDAQKIQNRKYYKNWEIRQTKANKEWNDIQNGGGSSINPFKVGPVQAYRNARRINEIQVIGGHMNDQKEAKKVWLGMRQLENGMKAGSYPAFLLYKLLFGNVDSYK